MANQQPTRVLVVDDSMIFRKVVRDVLGEMPHVEVVGTASDGVQALEKIKQLSPDLVTLDLEMPALDGLGVLERLQGTTQRTSAIMLSAHTSRGARATTQALRLGAFDFVLKPSGDSVAESLQLLREALVPKVEAFASTKRQSVATVRPTVTKSHTASFSPRDVRAIGIGISTGGPAALARVLPKLPANFPAPILIVQHMPPMFTKSLADDLNKSSSVSVSEAVDGQSLSAGEVVVAPGGKQMKVAPSGAGWVVRITDDPAERACRPSVDYLFRSLAEYFRDRALGVIMTGMGDDGTAGCRLLKEQGAKIVAQSEETCTVFGMPRGPINEGLADAVTPLGGIAGQLVQSTRGRVTACS